MDQTDIARAYYDAIDDGEYDRLHDLLATGFTHDRPDQTLEGRDRFVDFMQTERPKTETEHRIDRVYRGSDGHVAVGGRLLDKDERLLFEFLDTFEIEEEEITDLRTYVI